MFVPGITTPNVLAVALFTSTVYGLAVVPAPSTVVIKPFTSFVSDPSNATFNLPSVSTVTFVPGITTPNVLAVALFTSTVYGLAVVPAPSTVVIKPFASFVSDPSNATFNLPSVSTVMFVPGITTPNVLAVALFTSTVYGLAVVPAPSTVVIKPFASFVSDPSNATFNLPSV